MYKNGEPLCLTTINIYEVLKGFRYHSNAKTELEFEQFLNFINICTISDDSISKAADIYADLRKNGITIGDAYILIASIVISNNASLVSNNQKLRRRARCCASAEFVGSALVVVFGFNTHSILLRDFKNAPRLARVSVQKVLNPQHE